MRLAHICAAFGVGIACTALAAEPAVRVYCPAVGFDDRNDRGRNGPRGPHPVALVASGTFKVLDLVPGAKKAEDPDDPFSRDGQGLERVKKVEMVIERVFFGSPPTEPIRMNLDIGEDLPAHADTKSRIYGLTVSQRGGKLHYSLDTYYWYDRAFELSEIKEVEALSRARLDRLALSCKAVFVGRPLQIVERAPDDKDLAVDDPFADAPKTKRIKGVEVQVDRVLHGPWKVGDRVLVRPQERQPIPLPNEDAFVYFVANADQDGTGRTLVELETRWSTATIQAVLASLRRRGDYPIRETLDEADGRLERRQEIFFTGPRSEALAMLGSRNRAIELLAARRILLDDQAAIPDVLATIKSNLFRAPKSPDDRFRGQENLIRVLALLENHRPNGHVSELIESLLDKAEHGADFPSRTPDDAVNSRRWLRYDELDDSGNHSLAWLLRTLDEADAARLFGIRLLKLRDLASYGWKDEAQFVLDASHIEDHLELGRIEPKSKEVSSLSWPAGFEGGGLSNYRVAFSPNGKWFAAVGFIGRVWSTADWSTAGEFHQAGSVRQIAFSPDGNDLYVAGGGSLAILDRWDWRTGKKVNSYVGHDNAVSAMQLSPDGSWLLTSNIGFRKAGLTLRFDAVTTEQTFRPRNQGWYRMLLNPEGKRFLAKGDHHWHLGSLSDEKVLKLPFAAHAVSWAADDLVWSLEDNSRANPITAEKEPAEDPFALNPFSEAPKRRPSLLRQRQLGGDFTVVREVSLEFPADQLVVSRDRKTALAISDRNVAVLSPPEWKPTKRWQLPKSGARTGFEPLDDQFELSADGRILALARDHEFPRLMDAQTGNPVPLGAGHRGLIISLEFSADGNELTSTDDEGVVCRWKARTGNLLERRETELNGRFTVDQTRQREHEFTAEDGKVWSIVGKHRGYRPPSSFEIRVHEAKPDENGSGSSEDGSENAGKLLGIVEPKWGQYEPLGLVPGGFYFYVGTHVYSRADLKLVSAVNSSGRINQIVFSQDGTQYALITSEEDVRPSPSGMGVWVRREISQRLRVQNTRSGKTLFSQPAAKPIRFVVFSQDGSQLAVVNANQEIVVWQLPR